MAGLDQAHPAQTTLIGKGTTGVESMGEACSRSNGNESFEKGWSISCNSPLGIAHVARAPHPQIAIEPGLRSDPVEGSMPITGFVDEGFKMTLGTKAPTHTLDEHMVATFGKELGTSGTQGPKEARLRWPPVGCSDQNGWKGASGLRRHMVGVEGDAVGHGDWQVATELDGIDRRREIQETCKEVPLRADRRMLTGIAYYTLRHSKSIPGLRGYCQDNAARHAGCLL